MTMTQNVVMLELPGAGAELQAEGYARLRGIRWVSTGGILRDGVQHPTESGLFAKAIRGRGDLVGDETLWRGGRR